MVVSFAFIPAERIKDLQRKFKQQHTPDVTQKNCTCCCPVIAATGSTTATGHPSGITTATTAVLLQQGPAVAQDVSAVARIAKAIICY